MGGHIVLVHGVNASPFIKNKSRHAERENSEGTLTVEAQSPVFEPQGSNNVIKHAHIRLVIMTSPDLQTTSAHV